MAHIPDLIVEIYFNLLQPGIETTGRGVLRLFGVKDADRHSEWTPALVGAGFLTALIVSSVLFVLWLFAV